MSIHHNDGSLTNPTADAQLNDMLNLDDANQMNVNDFSADLLPDEFTFENLTNDGDFHSELAQPIIPQDSQPQNVPQPSVENPQVPNDPGDFSDNGDPDNSNVTSGVGAGPLPTGFGIQLPANVGSTLTDFTKRRNWSARVVEEIKDFLHILTPDGRIMYVSPSAKSLTGHEPDSLVGKFMTTFIHPDDNAMYVREFNESIASGNPLRFFFRFRKADDTYTIFESHGHPHFSPDVSSFGGSAQSLGFCRGFFMMARPYPTKNAALLDSFLEHKIENERLKKRIADLKREEQEEIQQQYMSPTSVTNPYADFRASSTSMTPTDASNAAAAYQHQRRTSSNEVAVPPSPNAYNGMPPPAKPPVSNYALTQRNLDEALATSRPDSINDKMMRYEGANHLEGIEMLTGLKYREGERSKGISTGAMSPMLVRGDAGVEIPPGQLRQNGRDSNDRASDSPLGESGKKKKQKVNDEYVCTDCGTLDSPEWRRGPTGPKTLCNACGLRWAKQEKKKSGHAGGANNGNQGSISGPSGMGMGAGPLASAGDNADAAGMRGNDGGGEGEANTQSGEQATENSNAANVVQGGTGPPHVTLPAGNSLTQSEIDTGQDNMGFSMQDMSPAATMAPTMTGGAGMNSINMGVGVGIPQSMAGQQDPSRGMGGMGYMGQAMPQGINVGNTAMNMFGQDPGGGGGAGGGGVNEGGP